MTELDRGTGRRGIVTSFDGDAGLGVITTSGGAERAFHCIEIADGTRSISVGAEVSYDDLPKLGRWEAANIRQ